MDRNITLVSGFENFMIDEKGFLWKMVEPKLNNAGYEQVSLYFEGKQRTTTIHRLVAEAFIPNPDNLSDVDHINGDKSDCRKENLRWCSHKDNLNYGHRNEQVGEANSKPLYQYDMEGNFIREWKSITELLRTSDYSPYYIKRCYEGKIPSAYGYIWKFPYRSDKTNKGRKAKPVFQYDMKGNLLRFWESVDEITNLTGFKSGAIKMCCNGKTKSSNGFIWRYKD